MIPQVPPDQPAVLTDNGPLRPERSILRNRPFLLLWHYDPVRLAGGDHLDGAALAGLQKTATRLAELLKPLADASLCRPYSGFRPLTWPTPELILFTNDQPLFTYDLIKAGLIQAETSFFVAPDVHFPAGAIEFRRC